MAKQTTGNKAAPKKGKAAKVAPPKAKKTPAKKVVTKKTPKKTPVKKAVTEKQPVKKVSKPKGAPENTFTPYPWTAYRKKQAKAVLIKQYNSKETVKVNALPVTYHPDGSATAPGKDFKLHKTTF